ncbi:hypothetical protein N0B51_14765, partial [Tsuneonella sp. YG55]
MPFKTSLPETGTWRLNIAIGTCVPLAYRPQTMRNVLFLFNHDAGHQVAHLAGTAAATARLYPEIACTIACATPAIRERLDTLIPGGDARRLEWVDLTLPLWARAIAAVFDRVLPSSRLLRLRLHRQMFAHSDVVVSTERTCLRVKRHLRREEVPLFVILPHGAGDRSVSYHPDFARFDSVLVAGEKVVDQMVEHGVDRGRLVVVGYPKFETVDLDSQPDFFGNGRPTFVYNPHFDPHLSSWYDCGPDLLRWFASKDGQHFNCIFAPHVMLFRKTLHISPEYKTSRRRPDVPAEALAAANILIDVDGLRLFDMSYMLAADAYIGDVSSQIYEFLARPRPAFFLDCRDGPDPRDEKWLMFRRAGPT